MAIARFLPERDRLRIGRFSLSSGDSDFVCQPQLVQRDTLFFEYRANRAITFLPDRRCRIDRLIRSRLFYRNLFPKPENLDALLALINRFGERNAARSNDLLTYLKLFADIVSNGVSLSCSSPTGSVTGDVATSCSSDGFRGH